MKQSKFDKRLLKRAKRGEVLTDELGRRFNGAHIIQPKTDAELIGACMVSLAQTFTRLQRELAGTEIRTMHRGWLFGAVGSATLPLRLWQ